MVKDKRLHIRITEDMQEKLKAAADKDGRTVANLVTKLISDYLEEKEMTRTVEVLEDQVKDTTIDFYNDLEKEYGIEFTAEEVQKAIRSHQDTIDYEEEKDLKEDEFEETYRDWMEDSKDEIVDARIEKNTEDSTARMEAYQREVGGGRLAYVEIDRSADEFITEYPTIGDAIEAARSTWENVSYSEKKRKKREVQAAIILAGEGADFYEDEDGEIRSDYEPICSFGEYV